MLSRAVAACVAFSPSCSRRSLGRKLALRSLPFGQPAHRNVASESVSPVAVAKRSAAAGDHDVLPALAAAATAVMSSALGADMPVSATPVGGYPPGKTNRPSGANSST